MEMAAISGSSASLVRNYPDAFRIGGLEGWILGH